MGEMGQGGKIEDRFVEAGRQGNPECHDLSWNAGWNRGTAAEADSDHEAEIPAKR